jgi:hypothetical protein
MLLILISLFFCWLIYREFKQSKTPTGFDCPPPMPVYKPYVVLCLIMAVLFAWTPIHYWHFQRYLSAIATELADSHPAKVHCNTAFDSMFDTFGINASHADPKTGELVIQYPWCATLMDYLNHPGSANQRELWGLAMLTHESMHVRGEYNEVITECEAVQRNYRTAKLLGVPDNIAQKNALDYYYGYYLKRPEMGTMQSAYFSDQCAPGKELDEHLSDSTWVTLETSEDDAFTMSLPAP